MERRRDEAADVASRRAPPPPTQPRKVPSGVRSWEPDRAKIFGGAIFSDVAAPAVVAIAVVPPDTWGTWVGWVSASPLVMIGAYGLGSLTLGLRGRSKRRRIYREGVPTIATVDRTTNPAYPQDDGSTTETCAIHWSFEVDGVLVHGRRESKFDAIREVFAGDSIWVLYDPEVPNDNVEWPPL